MDPDSLLVKAKAADALVVVDAGDAVIVVSGGVVSAGGGGGGGGGAGLVIVHEYVAGVGSYVPFASRARTLKLCLPTARPLNASGELHFTREPPSIEHWKVELAIDDTNANAAPVLSVDAGGDDVIVVFGAVRVLADLLSRR